MVKSGRRSEEPLTSKRKQSHDVEFHLVLPCGNFSSCCGGKSTASPGEAVTRRSGSSPPCDFKPQGSTTKKNQSDSSTRSSVTSKGFPSVLRNVAMQVTFARSIPAPQHIPFRELGRVRVRTQHNGHTHGYSACTSSNAIKHILKTTRKDLQVNAFKMISLFKG